MAAVLEIVRVMGLSTVQDGGRPGRMHQAIPPGGALVPELFARANRALGNEEGAPAIEVFGGIVVAAAGDGVSVATEDGEIHALADGARLEVLPSRALRVRYVAVRGGFDVPRVLGGRGTLLVAAFGGHEGRALRRGDRLALGSAAPSDDTVANGRADDGEAFSFDAPVRVLLGPDDALFDAAAIDALLSADFTLSPASNRVGARLLGPPLAHSEATHATAPMTRGAIEVPPSGEPIVLGPDHPTTGGYPVIATILCADLGRFAARPIGARVRFRAVTLAR